jgi:hypothetical protein
MITVNTVAIGVVALCVLFMAIIIWIKYSADKINDHVKAVNQRFIENERTIKKIEKRIDGDEFIGDEGIYKNLRLTKAKIHGLIQHLNLEEIAEPFPQYPLVTKYRKKKE